MLFNISLFVLHQQSRAGTLLPPTQGEVQPWAPSGHFGTLVFFHWFTGSNQGCSGPSVGPLFASKFLQWNEVQDASFSFVDIFIGLGNLCTQLPRHIIVPLSKS